MPRHDVLNSNANAKFQTSPWDELRDYDSHNGDANGIETIIPKQVVATGLSHKLMKQSERIGVRPLFGAQIDIEGTLNTQTSRIELTIDSGNLFGSNDFYPDKKDSGDVHELVIRSGQAYDRDDIAQKLKCNPETAMLISELTRNGVVAKYICQGNQLKLRGSTADGDRNSATRYLQFYAGQLMKALDNLGYSLGADEDKLLGECNRAVDKITNEMSEKNASGVSLMAYRERILRALRKEHPLVLPLAVTHVANNTFHRTMGKYASENELDVVYVEDRPQLTPNFLDEPHRASRNYLDEDARLTNDPANPRAYFVDMNQFLWR